MTWDKRWLNLFKKRKSWLVILSLLIKHQVKSQSWVDPSLEAVILITLDPKQDMFNAQKVNCKREKKLFILWPFTKSMLSIQEPKDLWLFLQVILEKLNLKSENKLIKKLPNGEKKEELRLFQVCCSLMRFICWILSATHSLTELLKVIKHQLS